ncbi:MAG TPA: hypothetical protein V6C99_10105 [Oculatellaceae cyanobacterium]
MQWLVVLLVSLVESIFTWFLKKGLKAGAMFLSYMALIISLFTAFLALIWATLGALVPFVPAGMGFILSLLPPSTSAYISAYFTVLIAKRVYDWHAKITKDFTQATLNF